MTIKSLLFDFDGLIFDTETTEIDVWKTIYSGYGFEFPIDLYIKTVGGWGISNFDPADHLHKLLNDSLDVNALRMRHHKESAELFSHQPVREGVEEYLVEARRMGLQMAIASSSPHAWVDGHLARLGLIHYFDRVICGDDVPPGRTKPHPDVFLKALASLQVRAPEAVVFEDSPNGVTAAHAAGIFVVAVPNPTTVLLDLQHADLLIDSMAALPLPELLMRVDGSLLKRQ